MPVLNNQAVFDKYDDRCTIEQVYPLPNAGGWFVLAQNGNSAYVEVQYGPEYGTTGWSDEQVLGSGAYGTIPRNASGIRFRNAVAGKAQVVTVFLGRADEPALGINNLGTVNVVTGATLNFQHNDVFVAAEPTADFEDVANQIGFTVTDDPVNTRVKVTPTVAAAFVFPGSAGTGGASAGAGGAAGNLLVATGGLNVTGTLAATTALTTSVVGDTQLRYQLTADGTIKWGGGTAALDCVLFRSAAGTLATTDTGLGLNRAAAASFALAAAVAGDTQNRWVCTAAGTMTWGPGNAAADVTLARTAAGTMTWTLSQLNLTTAAAGSGVIVNTSGAGNALRIFTSGDANPRLAVDFAGSISWGPGGATPVDVNLGRTGAGTLAMGGTTGTAQTRNRLEVWLSSFSLITLGETAAGNANPQLTFYRTASGGQSGTAMRLEMPSSLRGMVFQSGPQSTAYGSEAYTTLIEVNQAGAILFGPEGSQDVTLSRATANPTPSHLNLNSSMTFVGSTYEALLSVSPVPTTSVTPDYDAQSSYIIGIGGTGGGTLTINNPSNPPSATQTGWLYIQINNPPGNTTTTLAWGGAFSFTAVGGAPASVLQAGFWRLWFVWQGASWLCIVKLNA